MQLTTIGKLAKELDAHPKLLRSIVTDLGIQRPSGRKQYRLDAYQSELVKERLLCLSDCSRPAREQERENPINATISSDRYQERKLNSPLELTITNWRKKHSRTLRRIAEK